MMIVLSILVQIYGRYEVKVGKSMVNLITVMIKDQLKYSTKYARFAQHFYESV
jgi:hypothetical protein